MVLGPAGMSRRPISAQRLMRASEVMVVSTAKSKPPPERTSNTASGMMGMGMGWDGGWGWGWWTNLRRSAIRATARIYVHPQL